jgi:hypothetical protein
VRRIPHNENSSSDDHWQRFQNIKVPLMGKQIPMVAGGMLDEAVDAT